jgi:hypothetical protein
MFECKNTILCTFDMPIRRISAYDIHEWTHTKLNHGEEQF